MHGDLKPVYVMKTSVTLLLDDKCQILKTFVLSYPFLLSVDFYLLFIASTMFQSFLNEEKKELRVGADRKEKENNVYDFLSCVLEFFF